jgi:DNA polymerase III epsilon subunit-like protein
MTVITPDATLAFVDTETTHLRVDIGEVWEVAVILREPGEADAEYLWQIRPHLEQADPKALEINRFHERFVLPDHVDAAWTGTPGAPPHPMTRPELQIAVANVLTDAVVAGSNPGFDTDFLRKLLLGATPWHYRPVDIATLAAGRMCARGKAPSLPYSSHTLSRAMGVAPPGPGQAHTALGDARWARDVYDAATRRFPLPPLKEAGDA